MRRDRKKMRSPGNKGGGWTEMSSRWRGKEARQGRGVRLGCGVGCTLVEVAFLVLGWGEETGQTTRGLAM